MIGLLMIFLAPLPLLVEEDKDLAALQGTWQRTSMVLNGKESTEAEAKAQSVTFKESEYTLMIADQARKGTIKLASGKSPKEIEIIPASGPNKGQVLKGIYQLEGDTLTYCVGAPGKDRPTAFESKAGSNHMLYVNKKIK